MNLQIFHAFYLKFLSYRLSFRYDSILFGTALMIQNIIIDNKIIGNIILPPLECYENHYSYIPIQLSQNQQS